MFKLIRVPSRLEPFFRSLTSEFHWNHSHYFQVLVLLIAIAFGRRNVSNLYRQVEAHTHRSRFNNFMNLDRWDCHGLLHLKAFDLLAALRPQEGEVVYLIVDESTKRKRGKHMQAVGYVRDPVSGRKMRGHLYVTAVIKFRDLTIPWGVRIYVKKEQAKPLGVPFLKITELAAQLIEEFDPPAGVQVMVLLDSYYLCETVVEACERKKFHYAAALKDNRNLFRGGRKLKTGRYKKNLFRHRPKKHIKAGGRKGKTYYHFVDAGVMNVSKLGPHHVVFSRKGEDRHILGIVTDDVALSAEEIIRTYSHRWGIECFFKDTKQLLGLGQYQNGTYRAAVNHLHLVCFAHALLTHLRIEGEKGKRTRTHAARPSTRELQDQLRRLVWSDLVSYLKEETSGKSIVKELEKLLVA